MSRAKVVQVFRWALFVGIAGAAIAIAMDIFYLLVWSHLKYNMTLELIREPILFALWPPVGMLDGVDRPGSYNYAAHAICWAGNFIFYFVASLMPLFILKYYPQTRKATTIALRVLWIVAIPCMFWGGLSWSNWPTALQVFSRMTILIAMVLMPWTLALVLWRRWAQAQDIPK